MTADSLPTTQTVVCEDSDGQLCVEPKAPLPTLRPNEILVRNRAVAINPCDYKMHERFPCKGAIDGCDFAGEVLAIGSAVAESGSDIRVGDRVCGAVHGSNPLRPDSGSFAEYIAAEAEFALRIPTPMSFEQAAALGGTGLATLAMALFHDSALGLPGTPGQHAARPRTVLVHGGSSSVGTMAVQLLRLAGHVPIATCSPRNFAMVKKLGAVEVFDYSDPECGAKIKAYTKNALSYVLDPFTDAKSIALCTAAMGRAGGRYACLEMYPDYLVERRTLKIGFVMGPALLGHRLELDYGYERPADPEMRAFGVAFFKNVQMLLDQGQLKPHPIRVLQGPWHQAVLDGIDQLKRKAVSGEKLIATIDANLP